jgi:hypothetical protein
MGDIQWPYVIRKINGVDCCGIDPKGLHLIQVGETRKPYEQPQGTPGNDSPSEGLPDSVLLDQLVHTDVGSYIPGK